MPLVDRIGLALFISVALFFFVLGGLGPNPKFLDNDWWVAYFDVVGLIGLKVVLPFWLFLRMCDLMSGGPARRRATGRYL